MYRISLERKNDNGLIMRFKVSDNFANLSSATDTNVHFMYLINFPWYNILKCALINIKEV